MSTFAALGVPADVVSALSKRGITSPFPVQTATIPDALAGRDVCGRAPTGSGKTLAFGIPLVARVGRAQPRRPLALVLAPTRELAAQIERELAPLAAVCGRSILSVYGGVGYETQRRRLRKGVDVVVACPGRLADLVREGSARLDAVEYVVVDEADRMADMGFLPDVRRLLNMTAKECQTVLFSATLDGDVAVLVREYQSDPARHEVGAVEPDIRSARHHFWTVEQNGRLARTSDMITESGATIVFCRTRHRADRVARQLEQTGVTAASIHGGRSQGQRDRALKAFASGRVEALVATDVAARGIHVDGVACVVHFDAPEDAKAYLHRSGRTARAGASGVVVSFVGRDEVRAARRLQRDLGLRVEIEAPGAPAGRDTPRRREAAPAVPQERRGDDEHGEGDHTGSGRHGRNGRNGTQGGQRRTASGRTRDGRPHTVGAGGRQRARRS